VGERDRADNPQTGFPRSQGKRYRSSEASGSAIRGSAYPIRAADYSTIPGKHFEIRHLVDDIEKRRSDRMQAAVNKKFPKLAAWKASDGAKAILVFEQNDIQLTNVSNVTDSYLPLAMARTDRPDETYLVASCMGPPVWWMWPILIGNRSYYDIARSDEPSYWEFDPSKLVDVTSR
jgi:hypothetical protein